MGRLPFGRAVREGAGGSAGGGGGGAAATYTVSQLATLVEGALREKLPGKLRVVGEVSQFKARTHWYFELKDAGAVMSCVMWETAVRKAGAGGFEPAAGQQVVVTGRVEFWGKGGRTQVYVESIEPVGAGAADLALKKLVEELRGLGWLDVERKRRLPSFPRRVAVITSRTGAALADVLDTMRRRCPRVEVALVDVRVQGESAAGEVAGAVAWVSEHAAELGVDAVLLTRGGGSKEDLACFNDRGVAEAIVRCRVPVVSAIGHETDTTVAELVADERCATPTQAAMRLTPDVAALAEQVDQLAARARGAVVREVRVERERAEARGRTLLGAVRARLAEAARRVDRDGARLERHRPGAVYERRRAVLAMREGELRGAMLTRLKGCGIEPAAGRLEATMAVLAARRRDAVSAMERQLRLVGPESVLARGYSVTFDASGRAVRRAQDVRPGETISTKLAEGTVESTVKGLSEIGVRHGKPKRKREKEEGGPGLFGG
jgi:exodeoxyribonuclease VII large subunit